MIHPELAYYVDIITHSAIKSGRSTVYGNWHSSIAEAWMAVAVLTDDKQLWQKGVDLYTATSASYFRWGRYPTPTDDSNSGIVAPTDRIVGECSETLRDIVHTQFGLGGMLQAAELAWQQNVDLYKADGYALASVMELTARFINAWDAGVSALLHVLICLELLDVWRGCVFDPDMPSPLATPF